MTESNEHRIKLLVVDDEERFLATLAQRLGLRDFDVTAVSSGEAAIERAGRERFDLALVDLKMPGMSGDRVLSALKAQHPYLEVVMLTGHGSAGSAVECTKAGSHAYLQKPCETEVLLEALKEAYQQRVQNLLALDRAQVEQLARIAMG